MSEVRKGLQRGMYLEIYRKLSGRSRSGKLLSPGRCIIITYVGVILLPVHVSQDLDRFAIVRGQVCPLGNLLLYTSDDGVLTTPDSKVKVQRSWPQYIAMAHFGFEHHKQHATYPKAPP